MWQLFKGGNYSQKYSRFTSVCLSKGQLILNLISGGVLPIGPTAYTTQANILPLRANQSDDCTLAGRPAHILHVVLTSCGEGYTLVKNATIYSDISISFFLRNIHYPMYSDFKAIRFITGYT